MIRVRFSPADCRPCPALRDCVSSPSGRTPGDHPAAPATNTKPSNAGPRPPADRRLEGPLQDPRRRRRHHLPRRRALRPAQIPLPGPGEDQPPAPAHRRRHQPRPHRRPPHRHTPGPHPHQPLRSTSPRRPSRRGEANRARINQQRQQQLLRALLRGGRPGSVEAAARQQALDTAGERLLGVRADGGKCHCGRHDDVAQLLLDEPPARAVRKSRV